MVRIPVRFSVIGILFITWLLSGCLEDGPVGLETPDQTPVGKAEWYSLYFTQPDDPASRSLRGGPDADLAEAIEQARLGVDVAAYDLNLWSLRDALIAAHRRGVAVRVVAESDNLDAAEIQQLKEAGIPVLGDRREGLMHNKFVIIDRQQVWTGSMNLMIVH